MNSLQIPIKISVSSNVCDDLSYRRSCFGFKSRRPTSCYSLPSRKFGAFGETGSSFFTNPRKDGIFMRKEREKRVVVAKVNQGFDFNGGGGGKDNSNNARLLGNLALAVGLTYLSMTGQLGWILDAIVSIWLLAVILPIAGLGAFLWFAGRDIVQDSCPNCGNDFQIFKSSLKDGVQLCPFCTQPFSVHENKFVREPTRFSSNQSATFGQAFNGFSPFSEKRKASSAKVVDIEADVKDVD